MPKPSHVEAFELFLSNTTNDLRDYIAFGLFMKAEAEWAAKKQESPTDDDYKIYHEHILSPYNLGMYRSGADKVLDSFAHEVQASLSNEHRKFRWKAIIEAFLGAFFWTVFLIVASVIANQAGIDLLEVYKRFAGHS